MLKLYKGSIFVEGFENDNVIFRVKTVEPEIKEFQFREVKKYVRPIIEGKTYIFDFIPTTSPKFGKTHCLQCHYLKGEDPENLDGHGNILSERRMLIHGGSNPTHSAGCWLPIREKSYIKGFRFSDQDRIRFELVAE